VTETKSGFGAQLKL